MGDEARKCQSGLNKDVRHVLALDAQYRFSGTWSGSLSDSKIDVRSRGGGYCRVLARATL